MKSLIITVTFVFCFVRSVMAQDIFMVDSSYVYFFSEATLENIEAENTKAKGLINVTNGKVAFVIPIKSFEFDQELMKEHFNENYLESEKYKSATYKGQINEKVNLKKPGVYEVSVTGLLSIHGVEQNRTISGTVTVIKNQLRVQTKFNVKLVDHDIKIPTIVFQNIAEVIDVTVDLQFSPKK